MATGDRKVNIFINRLLSKTALKEQFFDYLSDKLDDTIAAFFQGQSGVLDQDTIGLAADGADHFKLDLTNADTVAVGTGEVITIPDATDVSKLIPFENAAAIPYYVGVRYAEVPWQIVDVNPKYGNPEYPSLADSLGEVGAPDAVTDTPGVKIALRIDGITEVGVDHKGRTVKVWMVDPQSGVAGTAFFSGTSYFSGGNNYVDIPYSGGNGPLGQDTSSDPPSTTPGDYRVFIEGVTWRRNTNLSTDSNYAFIGIVNGAALGPGNPPTSFVITGQNSIFLFNLDKAYDGAGAGLGRKITLDAGAVEMNTTASAGDIMNAQLRLDRNGSTESMQFMLQAVLEDEETIPLAALEALRDGVALLETENITLAGTVINFTRGGVNLHDLALRVNPSMHLCLISGADAAVDNGLYLIATIPSGTGMALRNLDGTLAAFTATTGLATVLHPTVVFANSLPNPLTGTGVTDWWNGFLFTLRDGQKNSRSMRVMPEKGGFVLFYDHGKLVPASYPADIRPRELLTLDPGAVGLANKYPIKARRSVVVRGGDASGAAGEEGSYARDGVRIWDAGGPYEDRDTAFAFAVDDGSPEDVPSLHTWPTFAVEQHGAVNRGHKFRDDFLGYQHGAVGATLGPYAITYSPNPGSCFIRDHTDGSNYGHGCIELITGVVLDDYAQLALSTIPCNLDTDFDFRWTYRSRLKVGTTADVQYRHGFLTGNVPWRFGFIKNNVETQWRGFWIDGVGTSFTTAPICNVTVNEYQWFEVLITPTSVVFTIEQKGHAGGSYGSAVAAIGSLSGQAGGVGIAMDILTKTADARASILDYWEFWDREALVGRFGTSHNLNHP
jgi:hypothetical protein